ncbi:MAG: hypothetical protein U0704_05315 [Candidatus Eisenbacteria bacterium]
MRARALAFPLLAALFAAFTVTAAVAAAPAAKPAVAVALPDTGLFAPVAGRFAARAERARLSESHGASAGRVLLLLATGRPDEAVRVSASLDPGTPEARAARGRALLAVQDFAALAALEPALGDADDERALRHALLFARDDAAAVDSLTRAAVAGTHDAAVRPELLSAGRLAYDRLQYALADSLFRRALAVLPEEAAPAWGSTGNARRAMALVGRALVQQKRRDWDGSLATLREALALDGSADVLMALTETLIRLGRTDEAISAAEWAVKLAPYKDAAHYLLGNGYARRNYTQLAAAYPAAFANAAGRAALAAADARLAAGDRPGARGAYAAVVAAHPGWVDARARLASLDFEDGRFAEARDGSFAALRTCPEYGRAHAILAKALESQRFAVDVHRAGYEARFAAAPMPQVPGIETFVANWKALSPRHQKRVALSIAPWATYVPVLVAGGASYYIKPLWMLLSECPNIEGLRDTRIDYDSRLWDDVRGCGGFHTVTGIEDVERTIFDSYNTVLHELTHQVHGVLPADDARRIQEHYRQAKERDDATRDGFLSRYAGGSVWEYFAEGANALASPMRDAYDRRDVVRERLDRIDPALRALVEGFEMRRDVSACYPVAYAGGGDDLVSRGKVDAAVPLYAKALELEPANETALLALSNALLLANRPATAESVATRAVAAHPASGGARTTLAEARWAAGRAVAAARSELAAARAQVRAEDRWRVDAELGALALQEGDGAAALAAYDSVLAYQSDHPEGLPGRARALAFLAAGGSVSWDSVWVQYERAVRMRTGIASLRCAYALDLLRAGRVTQAREQLDAAKLLDEKHPDAEALRAWADLQAGDLRSASVRNGRALAWGQWSDLAWAVDAALTVRLGHVSEGREKWRVMDARRAAAHGPSWTFRPELSSWERIHAFPAAERAAMESLRAR